MYKLFLSCFSPVISCLIALDRMPYLGFFKSLWMKAKMRCCTKRVLLVISKFHLFLNKTCEGLTQSMLQVSNKRVSFASKNICFNSKFVLKEKNCCARRYSSLYLTVKYDNFFKSHVIFSWKLLSARSWKYCRRISLWGFYIFWYPLWCKENFETLANEKIKLSQQYKYSTTTKRATLQTVLSPTPFLAMR